MRILITGANGFLGSHITGAAAAKHEVIALTRQGAGVAGAAQTYRWALGQPVPEAARQNIACAIHLAHDFGGAEQARQTVVDTLALVDELRALGTKRQLFFSSFSAGDHAASHYGRSKREIELKLEAADDVVIVRPGLVIGDGGLYGRIQGAVRRFPVIPLPDGGKGVVPVIRIERLCDAVVSLVEDPTPPRSATLSEPKPQSLRELVMAAAREAGKAPLIIPVPAGIMMRALKLAARLRIPLPANSDNLLGFLSSQTAMRQMV